MRDSNDWYQTTSRVGSSWNLNPCWRVIDGIDYLCVTKVFVSIEGE